MSLSRNPEALGAIAFAEQCLSLLDEASYNTTYKFAVLLALMDLVVEKASRDGNLATTLTTRQLAEKVIENYWHHVLSYPALNHQPLQGKSGQAEIISRIYKFRESTSFSSLFFVRQRCLSQYKKLVNQVEKKLIEMPLPRLQYFGKQELRFIYDISWSLKEPVSLKQVTAYQARKSSDFDNRIHLKPNVADYLVNLSGLLRPMIQRSWALQVAKMNKLEESKLQDFLFGRARNAIHKFASPLGELQNNRCFYCEGAFKNQATKKPEVDHFIPWARYPNDALANFVLAHSNCNNSKSDHFAATGHLDKWVHRNQSPSELAQLNIIAANESWELLDQSSISIAHTLYSRLPFDAELWQGLGVFVSGKR
jgi:hypothetical protein